MAAPAANRICELTPKIDHRRIGGAQKMRLIWRHLNAKAEFGAQPSEFVN